MGQMGQIVRPEIPGLHLGTLQKRGRMLLISIFELY